MPGDVPALLEAGRDALQLGDWSKARTAFDEALAADESAEALAGLGDAWWWLGETDRAIHCQTRAYASFRRRPDPMQAAFMAIGLYLLYRVSVGSRAAARGWLGRATRLVEEFDLLPLSGWVALLRAHDSGDVEAAHRWAREARDLARRFEDADLELCALSQLGAALVQLGRLDEGVPLLDEAMAASLAGEGKRLHTVVYTSCNMISSCSQVAEVARAAQWIRAADDFTRRYGCPHVYTLCRAYHGALLFAIGDWAGAEREYIAALRIGGSAERALRSQALAGLAELRLAQGRFEEAERLLEGLEEQLTSTSVLAALRLARGEASVAATLLRRRLRELDESADERPGAYHAGAAICLQIAELLELLVAAELDLDAGDEALATARRLEALSESAGCELITGRAQRALGRAHAAMGENERARERFEWALTIFGRIGMPFELARTRLLLSAALAASELEVAVSEASAAHASLEQLGASRDADGAAALLRSLGASSARTGPRGYGQLTRREREVLELLAEGLSNRELAERLFLTRKTIEHHVHSVLVKLDLRSRAEAAAYAVRYLEEDRTPG